MLWVILLAIFVLNVIDILLTMAIIAKGGSELNWIIGYLMGRNVWIPIKAGVMVVVLVALALVGSWWASIVLLVIYLAVVANNVRVYLKEA